MNIPGMDKIHERLEALDGFQVKMEEYLERIALAVETLVVQTTPPQYTVNIDIGDRDPQEVADQVREWMNKRDGGTRSV